MASHPQVWGAKGTLLQHGIASAYTTIAQRTKITPPPVEMGTRDTTDLDSTAETFGSTILKSGEVSLSLNYDPGESTHQLLQTLLSAGTLEEFQIVYASTDVEQFNAIVTKLGPEVEGVEENLTAEVTLKVSGTVTRIKNS